MAGDLVVIEVAGYIMVRDMRGDFYGRAVPTLLKEFFESWSSLLVLGHGCSAGA